MNQPWVYMWLQSWTHLPPHPVPLGHPSAPALSILSHASNLDWWSILHMVDSPRVCSYSCSLSWWCHLTILSSLYPFSSIPQSFVASGTSSVSWLFASGGQSIEDSASQSVLPMNIQGWFPWGLTGLIIIAGRISNRWGLLALSCFSRPPLSITVICPSGSPSYTVI